MLKNLSHFSHTDDYLPIITAALIIDMIILLRIDTGYINIKSLNVWYNKFGIMAVVADVLSIVIGIIIARFLYTTFFTSYSIISFVVLICIVQIIHDVSFAAFFNQIPRNKSAILDVFKDYAKELGIVILAADAAMMILTILLASWLATFQTNTVIVILIVACYILPYLLYSI
jgi:hypothetical protein